MPIARVLSRSRLTAGLALAVAATAVQAGPDLHLLVYPAPGLFDEAEGDRIGGLGGMLASKLAKASELDIAIELLPVARAWSVVNTQPLTCLLGMVRTADREARFQWVGVVSRGDLVVYGRADAASKSGGVATLPALRGNSVAVVRETAMATQMRELGIQATEVNSALAALRMLQAGRVDYWYSHRLVAEAAASAAGGPPIRPQFSAASIDGYLACNLDVPPASVDKLRQGLLRLRRNGDLAMFGVR